MLRLSKLTDYATVILAHMANGPSGSVYPAAEIAQRTRIGTATVSKLLKGLNHAGLVNSLRGPSGGYRLSRPAGEITAAQIIDALEGPVSITECSAIEGNCDLASVCGVGNNWQRINGAIRAGLERVTLAQLSQPNMPTPSMDFTSALQPLEGGTQSTTTY
ncbi:MAG: SUF system Fe-S cluster assembly regulator [Pseudomonadota bacterium]